MSKENVSIIIKHPTVVTMDKDRRIIEDGAVAIDGNKIVAVGKASEIEEKYSADKVIDGKHKILMPGFVDMHVHNVQTLLRGIITDYEISIPPVWLRFLIPYEAFLKPEDVELISTLTQLNMIEHGTTAFLEAGGPHADSIAKAMEKTGIRGVVTRSTVDMGETPEAMKAATEHEIKESIRLVETWNGKYNGRVRAWFSLRQLILCSQELFHKFIELAKKYNVGITLHVSEAHKEIEFSLEHFKKRPIEHLYDIGFLGKNVVLSHAAFLTAKEVALIGKSGASVAYCPSIDHMLMPPPRVPEMLTAGVNVTIGSDGGWKTPIDLLNEIRLASIIQKQYYGFPYHDRVAVDAADFLEMITINGAKALMWDDEIGSIEPGKKADLVLIDVNRPHFVPINDLATTIVYCASGDDVTTVIIDGKIVMEDRKFTTVDMEDILEKARAKTVELMEKIRESWKKKQ